MTGAAAAALLGLEAAYVEAMVSRDAVALCAAVPAAFRAKAKAAHPDAGGTAGEMRRLIEARDVLLEWRPRRPILRPIKVNVTEGMAMPVEMREALHRGFVDAWGEYKRTGQRSRVTVRW